jgi:undecaprenyl-diphosphatase
VVFLLVTMFGELTLFLASAAIVGRPRPDVPHLEGQLPTSSYPSGHVAATILLYAAIVVLAWPRTRAWWRWALVALAVLMPLWVALSRTYYGMHHPTDILGSVVLAAGWLAATVYLVRPNCDLAGRARGPARSSRSIRH